MPDGWEWSHYKPIPENSTDVIRGWQFYATMHLRTPLYVLERQGQLCDLPAQPPDPDFPPWAGIWTIKTKGFDAILGTDCLDAIFERGQSGATEIGPQPVDEYTAFLVAFRRIVESGISRVRQIALIEGQLARNNQWGAWIADHGGAEAMLRRAGFVET